ncbi:hypothetical protein BvCmsSIP038_01988 [Escherichia coli]|nr:hypothetical protein BvCmsSIP038_01988 [Escherichia coli]
MFDFPQPGEIYRSAGFPDVAVVGILEDGIPWEMPYRCPDIVWNPYRRKFSILVRILADGRTTDIPLGRFLREFTCDRPDLFKRSPVNRHAVLKEMAGDPELQKWREKYLIFTRRPLFRSAGRHRWRGNGGKSPARSLTRKSHRITVTAIICN